MPESPRLVGVTATCFLTAIVISLVALASSSWVVQSIEGLLLFLDNIFFASHGNYYCPGLVQFGLMRKCYRISLDNAVDEWCMAPQGLPSSWQFTASMLLLGIGFLCAATYQTFRALRHSDHLNRARWLSLIACASLYVCLLRVHLIRG
jgi:hypothetical protein